MFELDPGIQPSEVDQRALREFTSSILAGGFRITCHGVAQGVRVVASYSYLANITSRADFRGNSQGPGGITRLAVSPAQMKLAQ